MERRDMYVTEEGGTLNNYALEPRMYVDSKPRAGFTEYAEQYNGRLAMVGFISLILTEVLTHSTLVSLIGL
jgi:hypothetical protein